MTAPVIKKILFESFEEPSILTKWGEISDQEFGGSSSG